MICVSNMNICTSKFGDYNTQISELPYFKICANPYISTSCHSSSGGLFLLQDKFNGANIILKTSTYVQNKVKISRHSDSGDLVKYLEVLRLVWYFIQTLYITFVIITLTLIITRHHCFKFNYN